MTSISSNDQQKSPNSKSEENQLEIILKSKASKSFYSGNYEELYQIIENNKFNDRSKKQLQSYWLEAHYVEAERTRGKPLGPVEKYRIRKKYPMPETIWDGTNKSHCFQEDIRQYLHHQYLKDPYPTSNRKKEMSGITGLSIMQVSNWFKNRRQRDRAAIGKNRKHLKTSDLDNFQIEEHSTPMSHFKHQNETDKIQISNQSRFKGFNIADLCIENDNKKETNLSINSLILDNLSNLNSQMYFNYYFFDALRENCK